MATKLTEIIEGEGVSATARRKAKYGRKDWICWVGKDGVTRASVMTAETLKQAMLDCGTQIDFTCYEGGFNGYSMVFTWWVANNVRRRLKREAGQS